MRVATVIISFLISISLSVDGQKHDYNWLSGYDSFSGYDTSCQCWFGISKFDFNQSSVVLTRDSLSISFDFANSIISDSNGNLLFYSNGVKICNANDKLLQNGDSLGWGPLFSYYNPSLYEIGLPYTQRQIVLPNPRISNIYDIIYFYVDTLAVSYLSPDKLLHARVDVGANAGLGALINKDSVIFEMLLDGTIAAVKHGNGRDWWLCTNRVLSNCHELLLYDGNDSMKTITQCLGANSPKEDLHACRFSQDGQYYITTNDSGQVNVFNFDRCSGALSLKEEFTIPEIKDSAEWWPTGLEFSPDSRFFYIFCAARIYQYDLTAQPISSSKDTIAIYHYPGHYPANYFWGQLAPDGKIYINGSSDSYYISVIDSPNGKGSLCHFLDQSIELPTLILGLPYNPNYRLGVLPGSPCDTLTGLSETQRVVQEQNVKVYPNPATNYVIVDYGLTDWNKGQPSLEICNALGQMVYSQLLPMYSALQKISLSAFTGGVFTVFIKRRGAVVAASQFVKN